MEDRILQIYKYGAEVLNLKARDVANIDGETAALIDAMIYTLHNTHNAIGLAAPQVGKSLQISVIDLSMGQKEDELVLLLNPEILEVEGSESGDEGCLSFPGINLNINRSKKIFLKTFNLDGKEIRKEIEGFMARVIQHEIDHLNGVLMLDRVSSLKRQFIKKEIKRRIKDDKW
jgi:peptide deformylase